MAATNLAGGASRRPDPALGVFETMLVSRGHPADLETHLDRLGASLADLYDEPLPDEAAQLARTAAAPLQLGRLRLTVAPSGAGLSCRAVAAPVAPGQRFPAQGADLVGLPLPGGLGPHKWADRRRLSEVAEPAIPLLLDGTEVLEASRANVFAVRGRAILTPPADGRILPGITRAAVLAAAGEVGIEALEAPLRRDDLLGAEAVFLTGSVRGIEPARSLDGQPLGKRSDLSRPLVAALRAPRQGARRAAVRSPAGGASPGPPAR